MKNELVLDNYGVQEMRAEERIDVDGGGIILGPRWNGTPKAAAAVWGAVTDFFAGVAEGLSECSCVN